jgi:acyl-CoA thioesterase
MAAQIRKMLDAFVLMIQCIVPAIDTYGRRKVRFRVTQSTSFRLNVPFIQELGVEFISASDGRSTVALSLEAWHLNSWSVAHGGVIMSLLDVAMAVAGRTLAADAGGGVTVEMKTSFLQPAKAGTRLIVSGHAFHRSTTMAFCEGEVRDTDERLIAKAMGTFKYRKTGAASDG